MITMLFVVAHIKFSIDFFIEDFVQELPAKLIIPQSDLKILDILLGQVAREGGRECNSYCMPNFFVF